MGPFNLTDRRACGHPNDHCPECGHPTPSLRAEYCSIVCRYDSQEAQRWEQYEPPSQESSKRPTDEELAEREPERPERQERGYRRQGRHD